MRGRFPAYAGVAGSAVLFFLCAPIDWPGIALAWVALVPWLLALDRETSIRGTLLLGLLMSVGFVLSVLRWFGDAMADYAGISPAWGMAMLVLLAPALQPQFVVSALVRRIVRQKSAFWYATQGEYKAVMGNNPSYFQPPHATADTNRPVEEVSWRDATNYCGMLTERERAAGRIAPNAVYRLPTEAEWEYACRAGTTTRLSYGNDPGYAFDQLCVVWAELWPNDASGWAEVGQPVGLI